MSAKKERKKTKKEDRFKLLEDMMKDPKSAVNIATLLDTMNALILDLDIPPLQKNNNITKFLKKYKKVMGNITELLMKPADFDILKVIGRGSFGEVHLVRHKESQKVYSMKVLNKCESVSALYMEERNIMALTDSPWIVKLISAFMDANFLYMVMEYLPGGDLYTLLYSQKSSEDQARFYAAELVLAVDVIHSIGYIHRDIKPENVLINHGGHIKLADFGMCTKVDKRGLAHCPSIMGTPEYMSPELVMARGQGGYFGKEVDWWAVGVCIYEMLVGALPFHAESLPEIYENILNYRQYLSFPSQVEISDNAKNFVRALLTHRDTRLGRKGTKSVMLHAFFKNDDWTFETIHGTVAPWVPELKSEVDTRHFEKFEKNKSAVEMFPVPSSFVGNHIQFVGFTYFRPVKAPLTSNSDKNNADLEEDEPSTSALLNKDEEEKNGYAQELMRLQKKCCELEASKLEAEKKLQSQERENLQQFKTIFSLQRRVSGLEDEMKQVKQALDEGQSEKRHLQDKIAELEKSNEQMEMEYKLNELEQRLEQEKVAHETTKGCPSEGEGNNNMERILKGLRCSHAGGDL